MTRVEFVEKVDILQKWVALKAEQFYTSGTWGRMTLEVMWEEGEIARARMLEDIQVAGPKIRKEAHRVPKRT